MAVVLENSNPLGGALLALSGAAQGYQQRQQQIAQLAQQNLDNQYRQQQMAMESQRAQSDSALAQLQIQAANQANALDKQNRDFEATFKLPPDWEKKTPEQQIAYLQGWQALADQKNDRKFSEDLQRRIEAIPRGTETLEGKLPLDKAHVAQIQDAVRNGFKRQLELLETRLDAQGKLRARAAYSRAGGGSGNSERDAIAYATAYNVAMGREYTQAYDNARDEYNKSYAVYEAKVKGGDTSAQAPTMGDVQQPNIAITVQGAAGPQVMLIDPRTMQPVRPNDPASVAKPASTSDRTTVTSGAFKGATASGDGGKPAKMIHNGTTYYLHADGKYYTSPP